MSLSLQDGITTKKTSETFECIFQELFPPTPSSRLLSVPSKLTENYRWLKLKDSKTVQVFHQPASYKAPDPNKIETILIRKVWKVSSCRQVTTRLFCEYVITGYHPKAFSVGQTMALKKPNKPETPTRS